MSLETCCRLCLKDLNNNLGVNEFLKIADHLDLQFLILECFDVLVSDDESITKICKTCNKEVRYVHQIRKKVQAADERIRQFYTHLEVKQEVEAFDEQPEQDSKESLVQPEDISNGKDYKIETNDAGEYSKNPKLEISDQPEELFKKYEFMEIQNGDTNMEDREEKGGTKSTVKYRKTGTKKVLNNFSNFRCYICSTDFKSSEELSLHFPEHIGPGPQVCNICNQVVMTVRNLNMHLRRMHFRKGKTIPCDECSKNGIVREYSSNHTLQAHKRSVHEGIAAVVEKKSVCAICGKAFSRATYLKMHENRHTKAILYKCYRCPMSFVSKPSLTRHERVHTAEKPFKCDQCDAAFTQSNSLQQHKDHRHNQEKPFSCDVCGDTVRFKSKYVLRVHMKKHQKNGQLKNPLRPRGSDEIVAPLIKRNLKCNFCPALYYKEMYLCQHIVEKHPTESVPMIQCELCKEKDRQVYFLTQTEADVHAQNHALRDKLPEREKTCKECGQIFPNSLALHKHSESHKVFKCTQCGRDFRKSMSLRRHYLTVHLQEKPFKCDQCDASFGQLSQLTTHLKTHNRAGN